MAWKGTAQHDTKLENISFRAIPVRPRGERHRSTFLRGGEIICLVMRRRENQKRLAVEEVQFLSQRVARLFHFPFDEFARRVVAQ